MVGDPGPRYRCHDPQRFFFIPPHMVWAECEVCHATAVFLLDARKGEAGHDK